MHCHSTKNSQGIPVITCPIHYCIALLATAITVVGLLGPTRALATGCTADVVFLMDNTGSMQSVIDSTRANASGILDSISGGDERFEGIDVQYAVATYWGDPTEYTGGDVASIRHCPTGSLDVTPRPDDAPFCTAWNWNPWGTTCTGSSQRSGTFNALLSEDYYIDLMASHIGTGWFGKTLTIEKISGPGPALNKTFGSTFTVGGYKSGGKVALTAGNTYQWSIQPWGSIGFYCTKPTDTAYGPIVIPDYPWCHPSYPHVRRCDGCYPHYGYEARFSICPVSTSPPPADLGHPEIARKAFKVNQALTAGKSEIISAMAEWAACSSPGGCGGDWEEANYFALHQLATEGDFTDGTCESGYTEDCTDLGYKTNYAVGWREDAGKVIVWFGDAPSHCSTVSLEETLVALKTKNIVVAAINTYGTDQGIDTKLVCDGTSPTVGQATAVTEATKGTLTNEVTGSSSTVDAILDAVSKGIAQVGSAAAVSFSTGKLETSTHLYQSFFDASDWSGDLRAFQLDATTGEVGTAVWKAAEELDKKTAGQRVILTMGWDADNSVEVPAPFRWDSLSPMQQRDLRTKHGETIQETEEVGKARLAFLRGDRTNEGTAGYKFRLRGSVLGDVWHSAPTFYGKPSKNWADTAVFGDGDLYSDFKEEHASRDGVVYVGSNDGMLHAFDAATGEEILAYVPGMLYSDTVGAGYHQLTDPNYEHTVLYVDGTPRVTDAYISTNHHPAKSWRSVLIGTLGGGGRGLFALDVTDPSRFNESSADEIVLWEFDNSDDPHLGKTYSRPDIALLNNGKWAVIIGNGLGDTATTGTDAGEAQLFIITLEGGLDGTWTEGTDYWRITTNVGTVSNRNGLFSPSTVDLNNDGIADRVYAGDLHGGMWAFDLSSSNPNDWDTTVGSDFSTKPLFHAFVSDSTGNVVNQPITSQPLVIYHPTIEDAPSPNLMVLFGTGKFLEEADKTDLSQQSYYAVWDTGHRQSGSDLTRAHLAGQSFIVNDYNTGERVLSPLSQLTPDYEGSEGDRQYGWYIDLDPAERVTARSLYRGTIVHFNTIIPESSVCASGGTGWEMAVEAENGGSPKEAAFDFNLDGIVAVLGDTYTMPNAASPGEATIGYAGVALDPDQGMPAGPSIIGSGLYTSAASPESGPAPDFFTGSHRTLADIKDESLAGRRSWQELRQSY